MSELQSLMNQCKDLKLMLDKSQEFEFSEQEVEQISEQYESLMKQIQDHEVSYINVDIIKDSSIRQSSESIIENPEIILIEQEIQRQEEEQNEVLIFQQNLQSYSDSLKNSLEELQNKKKLLQQMNGKRKNYELGQDEQNIPINKQVKLNSEQNNLDQKISEQIMICDSRTLIDSNINSLTQISLERPHNTPIIIKQNIQQLLNKGFTKVCDHKSKIEYLSYNIPLYQEKGYKNAFIEDKNLKLYQEKGKQLHSIMADYFQKNQSFEPKGLSQQQITFIKEYGKVVEDYLNLRGMKVTGIEKDIKCEGEYKRIDLIAESNTECILIDWKFTKYSSQDKILFDHEEHFLKQIRIQKKLLSDKDKDKHKDKDVRMLILPLRVIDPIDFIEYSYEDIFEMQKNQASDPKFQRCTLMSFKKKFDQNMRMRSDFLLCNWEDIAKNLIQNQNFEQIDYFANIENSVELLFKQDVQESYEKIQDVNQFPQFYYIHICLCIYLNNRQDISISQDTSKNLLKSSQIFGIYPNYKTEAIQIDNRFEMYNVLYSQ